MTTAITAAPAAHRSLAVRLGSVVRLHLANPFTTLLNPLIILGAILVVSWAIWAIILQGAAAGGPDSVADASEGIQFNGAGTWVFVYMMVIAVQAMNLTFPLALGFSTTRRDFYLGTALTFVLLSIGWTVLYSLLRLIEQATGGWFIGGAIFDAVYFGDPSWWEYAIQVFCAFLFFFFVGSAVAAVYVRWRQRGLLTFFIGLAAVLVGAVALITFTGSWVAVGSFFATLGFTGSYVASLVVTVVAGVVGWLVLRRATPRS